MADVVIEAVAAAMRKLHATPELVAQAAREAIWAEVQTECDNGKANGMAGYAEGIRDAARIVRGGN